MRYSQMLIPTLREAPSDAEVTSHKLMLRAGYIRKLAAGVYTYLPLCLKVLTKIQTIVREEMARAGAQELLLPVVMPAELWQETGRWGIYGKELLRFKDRHDRDFCIGPTHEEAITDLVRNTVRSWRELPKNLYQIQTKFRDEIRPRFGLMRGREFLMKDGYSFDADEENAKKTYQKMYEAYEKIFDRCGLKYRAVEAGTGSIGGTLSHEFQVLADSGEDAILACDHCKYAANVEKAEIRSKSRSSDIGHRTSLAKDKFKKVATPGKKTVEEVAAFLKLTPVQLVKTLIFETDKGVMAGLVRGDHNIKEDKFKALVGCEWCHLADEKLVVSSTQSPSGFAGPVGLAIPIYADQEIMEMENFCTGANEKDAHLVDVNLGDFKIEKTGDIRAAMQGDGCARCDKGTLKEYRGIEVGQVFYLGTKYSSAMKAVYLDQQGKEQTTVMGCYGIGISRTAAAAIEQNHDEKGIIWPLPIAPFQVQLISMNQDAAILETAEKIYNDLQSKGVEVLYDDRDERAGVKFTDAELIGIPYFIVIGSKGLKDGVVELKNRKTAEVTKVPLDQIVSASYQLLTAER
ncbi:MAG: proline--tRNA ligase [Deltaproteobacteria bacterium]|nr:proline--tRNA ligase [Deltaproteobacteria bacterium]